MIKQSFRASVAIAALLPAGLAAAADCPASTTGGPEVEAVRALEQRGARVNVEGWTIDQARAFFAPEFRSIGPDGAVTPLDRILASFVDGRSRGWASRFDLVELDIRVHGCTAAIVVGLAEVRPLAAPADAPPWRIRFLNVWRRESGQWLYAANQYARVTPPQ